MTFRGIFSNWNSHELTVHHITKYCERSTYNGDINELRNIIPLAAATHDYIHQVEQIERRPCRVITKELAIMWFNQVYRESSLNRLGYERRENLLLTQEAYLLSKELVDAT